MNMRMDIFALTFSMGVGVVMRNIAVKVGMLMNDIAAYGVSQFNNSIPDLIKTYFSGLVG